MDRRAFVAGSFALLASPLAAEGQQAEKVWRIGFLSGGSASASPVLAAFRLGLRDWGWVEGQNVLIEARWAEGVAERLPDMARDLVHLNVDVIVTSIPGATVAAKNATALIPIVMVFGTDPVELGLVSSLARPGGNITGLTSLSADVSAKQFELLKEAVPAVSRVGVLQNPVNPWHPIALKGIESRGRVLGVRLQAQDVRGPEDLDTAFLAMSRGQAGAVLVLADPMTFVHRAKIARLAAKYRLPGMYGLREYAEAGGLISYWPNTAASFRRAASYVDKILKGAKPADLPVEQPTKFELVINLKTAKALGLTIPPSLLLRADHVIE